MRRIAPLTSGNDPVRQDLLTICSTSIATLAINASYSLRIPGEYEEAIWSDKAFKSFQTFFAHLKTGDFVQAVISAHRIPDDEIRKIALHGIKEDFYRKQKKSFFNQLVRKKDNSVSKEILDKIVKKVPTKYPLVRLSENAFSYQIDNSTDNVDLTVDSKEWISFITGITMLIECSANQQLSRLFDGIDAENFLSQIPKNIAKLIITEGFDLQVLRSKILEKNILFLPRQLEKHLKTGLPKFLCENSECYVGLYNLIRSLKNKMPVPLDDYQKKPKYSLKDSALQKQKTYLLLMYKKFCLEKFKESISGLEPSSPAGLLPRASVGAIKSSFYCQFLSGFRLVSEIIGFLDSPEDCWIPKTRLSIPEAGLSAPESGLDIPRARLDIARAAIKIIGHSKEPEFSLQNVESSLETLPEDRKQEVIRIFIKVEGKPVIKHANELIKEYFLIKDNKVSREDLESKFNEFMQKVRGSITLKLLFEEYSKYKKFIILLEKLTDGKENYSLQSILKEMEISESQSGFVNADQQELEGFKLENSNFPLVISRFLLTALKEKHLDEFLDFLLEIINNQNEGHILLKEVFFKNLFDSYILTHIPECKWISEDRIFISIKRMFQFPYSYSSTIKSLLEIIKERNNPDYNLSSFLFEHEDCFIMTVFENPQGDDILNKECLSAFLRRQKTKEQRILFNKAKEIFKSQANEESKKEAWEKLSETFKSSYACLKNCGWKGFDRKSDDERDFLFWKRFAFIVESFANGNLEIPTLEEIKSTSFNDFVEEITDSILNEKIDKKLFGKQIDFIELREIFSWLSRDIFFKYLASELSNKKFAQFYKLIKFISSPDQTGGAASIDKFLREIAEIDSEFKLPEKITGLYRESYKKYIFKEIFPDKNLMQAFWNSHICNFVKPNGETIIAIRLAREIFNMMTRDSRLDHVVHWNQIKSDFTPNLQDTFISNYQHKLISCVAKVENKYSKNEIMLLIHGRRELERKLLFLHLRKISCEAELGLFVQKMEDHYRHLKINSHYLVSDNDSVIDYIPDMLTGKEKIECQEWARLSNLVKSVWQLIVKEKLSSEFRIIDSESTISNYDLIDLQSKIKENFVKFWQAEILKKFNIDFNDIYYFSCDFQKLIENPRLTDSTLKFSQAMDNDIYYFLKFINAFIDFDKNFIEIQHYSNAISRDSELKWLSDTIFSTYKKSIIYEILLDFSRADSIDDYNAIRAGKFFLIFKNEPPIKQLDEFIVNLISLGKTIDVVSDVKSLIEILLSSVDPLSELQKMRSEISSSENKKMNYVLVQELENFVVQEISDDIMAFSCLFKDGPVSEHDINQRSHAESYRNFPIAIKALENNTDYRVLKSIVKPWLNFDSAKDLELILCGFIKMENKRAKEYLEGLLSKKEKVKDFAIEGFYQSLASLDEYKPDSVKELVFFPFVEKESPIKELLSLISCRSGDNSEELDRLVKAVVAGMLSPDKKVDIFFDQRTDYLSLKSALRKLKEKLVPDFLTRENQRISAIVQQHKDLIDNNFDESGSSVDGLKVCNILSLFNDVFALENTRRIIDGMFSIYSDSVRLISEQLDNVKTREDLLEVTNTKKYKILSQYLILNPFVFVDKNHLEQRRFFILANQIEKLRALFKYDVFFSDAIDQTRSGDFYWFFNERLDLLLVIDKMTQANISNNSISADLNKISSVVQGGTQRQIEVINKLKELFRNDFVPRFSNNFVDLACELNLSSISEFDISISSYLIDDSFTKFNIFVRLLKNRENSPAIYSELKTVAKKITHPGLKASAKKLLEELELENRRKIYLYFSGLTELDSGAVENIKNQNFYQFGNNRKPIKQIMEFLEAVSKKAKNNHALFDEALRIIKECLTKSDNLLEFFDISTSQEKIKDEVEKLKVALKPDLKDAEKAIFSLLAREFAGEDKSSGCNTKFQQEIFNFIEYNDEVKLAFEDIKALEKNPDIIRKEVKNIPVKNLAKAFQKILDDRLNHLVKEAKSNILEGLRQVKNKSSFDKFYDAFKKTSHVSYPGYDKKWDEIIEVMESLRQSRDFHKVTRFLDSGEVPVYGLKEIINTLFKVCFSDFYQNYFNDKIAQVFDLEQLDSADEISQAISVFSRCIGEDEILTYLAENQYSYKIFKEVFNDFNDSNGLLSSSMDKLEILPDNVGKTLILNLLIKYKELLLAEFKENIAKLPLEELKKQKYYLLLKNQSPVKELVEFMEKAFRVKNKALKEEASSIIEAVAVSIGKNNFDVMKFTTEYKSLQVFLITLQVALDNQSCKKINRNLEEEAKKGVSLKNARHLLEKFEAAGSKSDQLKKLKENYEDLKDNFLAEIRNLKNYDDLAELKDKLKDIDDETLKEISGNEDWQAIKNCIDLMLTDKGFTQRNEEFLAIKFALTKLNSEFKSVLLKIFNSHYKWFFVQNALFLREDVPKSLRAMNSEKINYILNVCEDADCKAFETLLTGAANSNFKICFPAADGISDKSLKTKALGILGAYKEQCLKDFEEAVIKLGKNFSAENFNNLKEKSFSRFLKGETLVDATIQFLENTSHLIVSSQETDQDKGNEVFQILNKVFNENKKDRKDFLTIETEFVEIISSLIRLQVAFDKNNEEKITGNIVNKIVFANTTKRYDEININNIISQIEVIDQEFNKNIIKEKLKDHCRMFFDKKLASITLKNIEDFVLDAKCCHVGNNSSGDPSRNIDKDYEKVFSVIKAIDESDFSNFEKGIHKIPEKFKDHKVKLCRIYRQKNPVSFAAGIFIYIIAAGFRVKNFFWDFFWPVVIPGASDGTFSPKPKAGYNTTISFLGKYSEKYKNDAILHFLVKGEVETKHPKQGLN